MILYKNHVYAISAWPNMVGIFHHVDCHCNTPGRWTPREPTPELYRAADLYVARQYGDLGIEEFVVKLGFGEIWDGDY